MPKQDYKPLPVTMFKDNPAPLIDLFNYVLAKLETPHSPLLQRILSHIYINTKTPSIAKNPLAINEYQYNMVSYLVEQVPVAYQEISINAINTNALIEQWSTGNYQYLNETQAHLLQEILAANQTLLKLDQGFRNDALELSRQICATDNVRYNIYNYVHNNYEHIAEIATTNPSILTIYIYTHQLPNIPLDHPGTIVRKIRESFQQLLPQYNFSTYWKKLSHLSHADILNHYLICARNNISSTDRMTNELLILSAIYDVKLPTDSSSWLRTIVGDRFNAINHRNKVLQLLFKDLRKTQHDEDTLTVLNNEIIDIIDYCQQLNPDTTIHSTSWNGLRQLSERWHRDTRAQNNYRETKNIVHWNSLIDKPVTLNNRYIVIPLTNSDMLKNESDEVQHCVHSYSNNCSNGHSRIFAVKPVDKKQRGSRATLEISLDANDWTIRQLRGHRNQPVPDTLKESLNEITQMYSQKWNETPSEPARHTTWTTQRTPKEKV